MTKELYPRLKAIVSAVGGEAEKELAELLALAVDSPTLGQVRTKVQELAQLLLVDAGPAPKSSGRTVAEKKPAEAPVSSNVEYQLLMLRAKADGLDMEQAYDRVKKLLGIGRRKEWRRTVGALFARTQGKFRADFVHRAVAAYGEDILSELASIYTNISGETVSVAALKREARG